MSLSQELRDTAVEAITNPQRSHDMYPPLSNTQMHAIKHFMNAVDGMAPVDRAEEIVGLLKVWGERYLSEKDAPRLPYGIKALVLLAMSFDETRGPVDNEVGEETSSLSATH